MCPMLINFGFALAKKTKALYQFLGKPEDYLKTIFLEFHRLNDNTVIADQKWAKIDKSEEAISELIEAIIKE